MLLSLLLMVELFTFADLQMFCSWPKLVTKQIAFHWNTIQLAVGFMFDHRKLMWSHQFDQGSCCIWNFILPHCGARIHHFDLSLKQENETGQKDMQIFGSTWVHITPWLSLKVKLQCELLSTPVSSPSLTLVVICDLGCLKDLHQWQQQSHSHNSRSASVPAMDTDSVQIGHQANSPQGE